MRACFSLTENQTQRMEQLAREVGTGFEIRLDSFAEKPDFADLRSKTSAPLLATYRSLPHFGAAPSGSREERGWAWRRQCLTAGFELIDLELDERDLAGKIAYIQDHGGKAVLSHHGTAEGDGLDRALETALATRADILKIVGANGRVRDFELQRQRYRTAAGRDLIHFQMGSEFKATRILSLIYGAPFTFVATGAGEAVAPGQPTLKEITEIFRPSSIEAGSLRLFGVIGSPIAHSQSPSFHNARLKEMDENALFLPFPAANAEDLSCLLAVFPELRGLAVTSPMKEVAFKRAASFVGADVRALGSINTLLPERTGIRGANTDLLGIMEILEELEDPGPVRVIGYGGLGKAVVRACLALGLAVEVCNRTDRKLADLPGEAIKRAWRDRHQSGPTILVQATSVGMAAQSEQSPLERVPHSVRSLVETIYHPRETMLMRMARARGIRVVDGEQLFRKQARIQNQFFQKALGQEPPKLGRGT